MRILMSLLIAVFLMGGQAVAGDDPCENESGAAYGLCNAYCVAMDCDDPVLKKASDKACEKIDANYHRLYDEHITCGPDVQVDCPCWDPDDILAFDQAWVHGNQDDCYIEDDGVAIQPMNDDGMQLYTEWDVYPKLSIYSCVYDNPPTSAWHSNITYDEMNACIGIVQTVIKECPGL